jgi:hypothetical protein
MCLLFEVQTPTVIASEAKQPRGRIMRPLSCFVTPVLATTE